MPPAVGAPFAAALMRLEAELLLADADVVSAGLPEPRTDGKRRADALVALAQVWATPYERADVSARSGHEPSETDG